MLEFSRPLSGSGEGGMPMPPRVLVGPLYGEPPAESLLRTIPLRHQAPVVGAVFGWVTEASSR